MQSSIRLHLTHASPLSFENDLKFFDSHASTGILRRVSGRLTQLLQKKRPPKSPARVKVLIVEDEETICFSMGEYFRQHGFSVDIALEVERAEELILENDYDVLIQDLRLGMNRATDGLEIIRFTHSRSPDTHIVVLTAYATPEAEREARSSGAEVFLSKPKPLSQVAQVVQSLVDAPRRKRAGAY